MEESKEKAKKTAESKKIATKKVEYPERPSRSTGYSEEWILAFFENEARITRKARNDYIDAIKGKDKKDRSKIFYQMFIEDSFIKKIKSVKKKASKKEEAQEV